MYFYYTRIITFEKYYFYENIIQYSLVIFIHLPQIFQDQTLILNDPTLFSIFLCVCVIKVPLVQFVLPICSWICGLLLEHGHSTRCYTLKKINYLSPSNYQLSIALQLGPSISHAGILSRLSRYSCVHAVKQLWVHMWTCFVQSGNDCSLFLILCHSLGNLYCLSFTMIPTFCGVCVWYGCPI